MKFPLAPKGKIIKRATIRRSDREERLAMSNDKEARPDLRRRGSTSSKAVGIKACEFLR